MDIVELTYCLSTFYNKQAFYKGLGLYRSTLLNFCAISKMVLANEKVQLPFGVYVGQVKDGKPHGPGEVTFNADDNIVGIPENMADTSL